MTTILAIDVGTSAVKAALVHDGVPGDGAEVHHPLSTPRPGWAEQHPDDWWSATIGAVRDVLGCDGSASGSSPSAVPPIDAVAVTGQMQDLIPVDHHGRPTRPAILYSDTRATTEHHELVDLLGDPWAEAIGARPDATNVVAKWRWVLRHEPGVAARTTHVLFGGHSAIVQRLTGVVACDPTTAATTGAYSLASASWWDPAVREFNGCSLPDVVAPTAVCGRLTEHPAADLGLRSGIPVVHANGDAVATTVGLLGRDLDRPYAYLGTSGWVAVATTGPRVGSGLIVLPGLDDRHWVAAAPMPTAGAAIDWAREQLFGGIDAQQFATLAGDRCAIADGVVFVPHIDGTRTPYTAPDATGVLMGVRRSTDQSVLAAAVHEGVAHAVRQLLEVVAPGSHELAVCGGAARSDLLRQVIADVTGARVVQLGDDHASVAGVAVAATLALDGEVSGVPPLGRSLSPRADRSELHRRAAASFDEVLPRMASILTSLVEIRSVADRREDGPAPLPAT
ncbi:xylulokinase [soil metagenome]